MPDAAQAILTPMNFPIAGGDYEQAGLASGLVKQQLKKIGAAPADIRRVMIAAYEAEMNVVIHSHGGYMTATLDDGKIEVQVIDTGPGIADIELAMKEGYSTAPPKARELGFGAGLGLPNIKRNSDRFSITSTPGKGTRVAFTVFLRRQQTPAAQSCSLAVAANKCTQCLRCLHACPMAAIRIRQAPSMPGERAGSSLEGRPIEPVSDGANHSSPPIGPIILDHVCIDCANCIRTCQHGVFGLADLLQVQDVSDGSVLLAGPEMLMQLGHVSPQAIAQAVRGLGFDRLVLTDRWQQAHAAAVIEHSHAGQLPMPVISTACPAIVNLIEARFPSLIPHLAPLAGPLEAAITSLCGSSVVVVAPCPAQRSVVRSCPDGSRIGVITPSALRGALMPLLNRTTGVPPVGAESTGGPPVARHENRNPNPEMLRVTGMLHVINALEEIENSLMTDVGAVELLACDEGCFGSPLYHENPYLARHRWLEMPSVDDLPPGQALPRTAPFAPRQGVRLDDDMTRAIEKLATIDQLLKSLPGYDCGLCGCPTCATLAQDVVQGRCTLAACPRRKG